MEEIIDIGLGDLEPISINLSESHGGNSVEPLSVNFGDGIEMFMNDSQRSASKQVSVDMSDLDRLEEQINSLSDGPHHGADAAASASASGGSTETKSLTGMAADFFGFGSSSGNAKASNVKAGYEPTDSKLGQSTTSHLGSTKTWDGFTKVGDIPSGDFGRGGNGSGRSSTNNMSEREQRRKKREMIKRLQEWYDNGQIKQLPSLNLDTPYDEVEDEYETALADKHKKDSIKLQGWWFITLVNSLEYANYALDPFGVNLDGWGEKVSEDLPEYEELFGELHDKYKGGKLAPELSLLMRLGFSAAVVGFSNKALSSAAPGFADVIRQSPDLMNAFNDATVKALSQQSPGFAFAANMVKPSAENVATTFGPPPKPVETKNQPPPVRPGAMHFTQEPVREYDRNPANRPDLTFSRGQVPTAPGNAMFRENGVSVNHGYADVHAREHIPTPSARAEMRGPQNTDVDDILAGLKMKTVNIHEQVLGEGGSAAANAGHHYMGSAAEDSSIISATSLRDLHDASVPKKTNRRKPRSERNSISLGDI
jgi:hypothetical protein